MKPLTIYELAQMLGAVPENFLPEDASNCMIHGVNTLEAAQNGELSFVSNPKYASLLAQTYASAVLVRHDAVPQAAVPQAAVSQEARQTMLLYVDDPQAAFLRAVQYFYPQNAPSEGVRHPSAVIAESAQIHASARIGANVVVGEYCTIGANTCLYANVVCYDRTEIGANCLVHAGTVLGSDGFGFVEKSDGSFEKIPHVGNVVIGDNVEIGANCTIDRAALGSTRIESGVKLDNLIHVAHNVVIGENTAIAAQTGVSGSTKLGKRNRVAGQVGFVGHITTADDITVFAQSGVSKSLRAKGSYFGTPAKPHYRAAREEVARRQLVEALQEIRALRAEIELLQHLNSRQQKS
jgi:UDP-3-O-[3-hydroxymyristoyl] glucosamine N-acyltransferase